MKRAIETIWTAIAAIAVLAAAWSIWTPLPIAAGTGVVGGLVPYWASRRRGPLAATIGSVLGSRRGSRCTCGPTSGRGGRT
jgi:hypothetical protein